MTVMKQSTTMGQMLIQDALPEKYRSGAVLDKKGLKNLLVQMANEDPKQYSGVVTKLKRIGDNVTTEMGITVGLDDIEPDYARRNPILKGALQRIKKTTDVDKRRSIINATQKALLDSTAFHPGQMTPMAQSGSRGSMPQLMRTVSSPVAVVDDKNQTIPWLISRSFSEGLKAPDIWTELQESRRNVVESNLSVSAPGEVSKLLINTMSDVLVTEPDCGTRNGRTLDPDDANILDRYLARTNELITPRVADRLRKEGNPVLVRSPMTCESHDGVCQRCQGLNEKGNVHGLGTNVGVRSAQALSQPLTQMSLDAKHGGRVAGTKRTTLGGLAGFRQLTDIPKIFPHKATLASRAGRVTETKEAPQGGHYVTVEKTKHYVAPGRELLVKPGSTVEAGDRLSSGVPKPDEIVQYKGLGEGRRQFVDALHDVYTQSGSTVDKRHLELLAKANLNYVKMLDEDSEDLGFMRGDVVPYNQFRKALSAQTKMCPVEDSVGNALSNNVLHFTAGTEITPSVAKTLARYNIQEVPIAPRMPKHTPVMTPIARTPLMNPDFLTRLGHRGLKRNIVEAATTGQSSNIHGTHPIPAFIFGSELGERPGPRY